jgi:hypothetical protein
MQGSWLFRPHGGEDGLASERRSGGWDGRNETEMGIGGDFVGCKWAASLQTDGQINS